MRSENTVSVRDSELAPPVHRARRKLIIDVGPSGGTVVLRCSGRIVYGEEANRLCAALGEILPTARRAVVDLTDVESIDSAGLGELVLLNMWADAAGYELKFANPNQWVWQLLDLTNLDSVFDIYPTLSEALGAVGNHVVTVA